MVFHAALIVTLGLVLRSAPRGAGEEPIRTAGIVLRHVTSQREWFEGEEDQPQDGNAFPENEPSADDLLGALPGLATSGPAAQRSMLTPGPAATEELAVGDAGQMTRGGGGSGRGGAGGVPGGTARVRVFGAEGVGTSFLYLFDRSASMEGAPLAAAKRELLASLDSLDSTHQFHILFFNHEVRAFDLTGGRRRIAYATDVNKELAARFLGTIAAYSGTDRLAALLKGIDYRADVIFFLTDAEHCMSAYEVDRVTASNRGRSAITCIEFGSGRRHDDHNFLIELAHRNGGQYVYVNTRSFVD
jgi:hypothetical protein